MLCDICKRKKATVHLTEIINDEVTELHLCEDCAKSKGTEMQQHFSIADLLSGLVDLPVGEEPQKKEHVKLQCASCGMTYSDFKKIGRFGCADCYETFKRALYPLLKRIHGTTRHIGKEPQKAVSAKKQEAIATQGKAKTQEEELGELKARLAKAIKAEAFEEAAVLRDKIKALEDKGKNRGKGKDV
jgi:protein arginine kinase activator